LGGKDCTTDVGGLSPVRFMQTSWIDPKLTLLDNNPTESQEIYLAFPCAEYPSGSFGLSHIRMIHKTQKLSYIKDLQVTGSGPNAEWQTDERLAATSHGVA
jgi:hypothetical protein